MKSVVTIKKTNLFKVFFDLSLNLIKLLWTKNPVSESEESPACDWLKPVEYLLVEAPYENAERFVFTVSRPFRSFQIKL